MSMFARPTKPETKSSVFDRPTMRSEAVAAALEEHERFRQDNAFLRDENARLSNGLKVANELIKHLKEELAEVRDARDFLHGRSKVMTGSLHNIKLIICAAEEKWRAEAYAPPGSGVDTTAERTAEAQEKIDQAAAEVAKMLAPNPVATDAAIRAMEVPGNA